MRDPINSKLNILILSSVFLAFFLKSIFFLDPDFGWHIKMGELILNSGIPKTDPFSYTMSSFPFVDHEWLTNIILYILYQNIGYAGLAFVFSTTALFSVLILFRSKQKKYYIAVPIVLATGTLLPMVGIRPQAIAWVFFSVLITIFLDKDNYKKLRFFMSLVFLFVLNIHAEFAIGIVAFFLFLAAKTYREKQIQPANLVLFSISIGITLVNPYGIGLWEEILRSMLDSSLRWTVVEWIPAIFIFNISMWTLLALSGFLLIRFRKSFGLFEKTIYLGLLVAGLSSVRHMAFWALISVPVLSKCLMLLSKEASKFKYGRERLKKAYSFLVILSILIVILPIISSRQAFSPTAEDFYPGNAIEYLKKHPNPGNTFSQYGWGGYLIWKLPSKKVFIDGRMPSWRWKASLKNESNYAFKEYKEIMSGKTQFNNAVSKYNIDTVLLPVLIKNEKSSLDRLSERLEDKIFKKDLPAGRQGNYDDIYVQLEKDGWKIVYKDDIAIIYSKTRQ